MRTSETFIDFPHMLPKALAHLFFCMFSVFALPSCDGAFSKGSGQANLANGRDELIGTWEVVSAKLVTGNGQTTDFYGKNPKGRLSFDALGNYSLIVLDGDSLTIPFVINNRERGTDLENRRVVHGSIANYGKYDVLSSKVNPSADSLALRIEYATFPNWRGITQRRKLLLLTKDTLKYEVNPASSNGIAIFVWSKTRFVKN